jgi:hypothetical protein
MLVSRRRDLGVTTVPCSLPCDAVLMPWFSVVPVAFMLTSMAPFILKTYSTP